MLRVEATAMAIRNEFSRYWRGRNRQSRNHPPPRHLVFLEAALPWLNPSEIVAISIISITLHFLSPNSSLAHTTPSPLLRYLPS